MRVVADRGKSLELLGIFPAHVSITVDVEKLGGGPKSFFES